MATLWNTDDRNRLLDRASRLDPTRPPRWGKMSAPAMVAHLTQQLRLALGEVRSNRIPGFFRYFPFRELIVYVLPWPKGAPTAPELLTATPSEWEADLAAFRDAVQRVTDRRADAAFEEHPAFGKLSRRAWGVLIYRHIDHHLRQFGA